MTFAEDYPPASRTQCRWMIVAVATAMSTLMYLDRFCVPFAESFIREDLGLTGSQTSWIMTVFFGAYAVAQIPSGWLSDRWGGRLMLTIYILAWSTFTLLIGWSTSLYFLLAMQLGHGLGQAGGYPTSAGLLSRWMPLQSRGTASSIVAFGGRLGGFIAPILTAWLIVLFVPVTTSSLLTNSQLLTPEVGRMCVRITAAVDARPGQESAGNPEKSGPLLTAFWSQLSPAGQKVVRQTAATQRALDHDHQALLKTNPQAAEQPFTLDQTLAGALADELNVALKTPGWVKSSDTASIKSAREAETLLQKQEQGQGRPLTSQETERLNRLTLEALFPSAIGKVYVQGWRKVVMVYGLAGIFVAMLCWVVVRNQPQDHPWCNAEELALIQAGRNVSSSPAPAAQKLDWGKVLQSHSLWLSSISQFGTNVGWYFAAAKLPTYLDQVHHIEIIKRGNLSSLPMLAGIVGMLLGGRLTDWMRQKWGVRWGRALPMGLTRFGAAAAYIGCMFAEDPFVATILCATVAFFTDLGVAASWAFVQDAGGRYVGVVLGFGNMWGNIGAAMAPQFYDVALSWSRNDWNVCFILCSSAMVISGIAGLLIDASQPIVKPEEQI